MRSFLHLRYNPNADIPGKWSVYTSKGALRCNLYTFEDADRWARDFCADTGSVYGDNRPVDEPSWKGGRSGYFDQDGPFSPWSPFAPASDGHSNIRRDEL